MLNIDEIPVIFKGSFRAVPHLFQESLTCTQWEAPLQQLEVKSLFYSHLSCTVSVEAFLTLVILSLIH